MIIDGETHEEISGVVEEIAEAVADTAAVIIEAQAEKIEVLEEINTAIIDAAIEKEAKEITDERFSNIWSAISELRSGLEACQNNLETCLSMMAQLSQTAETAGAMAETSLILQASNHQSADAEDPASPILSEVTAEVDPTSPPEIVQAPPQNLRKKRTRLL